MVITHEGRPQSPSRTLWVSAAATLAATVATSSKAATPAPIPTAPSRRRRAGPISARGVGGPGRPSCRGRVRTAPRVLPRRSRISRRRRRRSPMAAAFAQPR